MEGWMVLACIRPCVNNHIGEILKIKLKCSPLLRRKNNLKRGLGQMPNSSKENGFLLTTIDNEKMSILK
jgi:hypothetical protein